jgi:glutamine synthetase
MQPPKPVEENVYNFDNSKLKQLKIDTLPSSLTEALNYLSGDMVIKDTLGPVILESFMKAKRKEVEESRLEVTPWEKEHYL